ncbi:tRNA pseudouridine(13) synthase TruD [Candidatus Woesearchaeota archaeon]|nr:tRNA pseudouridine(13) synthase TruD [Candidatus Woesearchaeota archaeon]
MYTLKQNPEDFIVKEILKLNLKKSGKFNICLLKKTNFTTLRAIEFIAKAVHVPTKDIGFAGTKDKHAITEQYLSIKGISKEKISKVSLKDLEITHLGFADEPISLGRLEGNEFIITIRDTDEGRKIEKKLNKKILMPNYFGEQRFSKNNKAIGKALVRSDFKKAIDLILETNPDYQIQEFLDKNKANYTTALKIIPHRLLKLYIHSYQSYLWNKTLKNNPDAKELPIIGFGTEPTKEIEPILKEENLGVRDFINKKIPELTTEGTTREAYIEIKDLKLLEKNPLKISFTLEKGSYATIAVAFLLECLDSVLKDLID